MSCLVFAHSSLSITVVGSSLSLWKKHRREGISQAMLQCILNKITVNFLDQSCLLQERFWRSSRYRVSQGGHVFYPCFFLQELWPMGIIKTIKKYYVKYRESCYTGYRAYTNQFKDLITLALRTLISICTYISASFSRYN